MKAITWAGIHQVKVDSVPDPQIRNKQDMIVKVRLSSVSGSDLHSLGGYVPAMQSGDILGRECMGEVAEIGPEVKKHSVGDRVVVCSVIACGRCIYCKDRLFSSCENSSPSQGAADLLWGQHPAGVLGYPGAMGGFAGSHAEYVRVPFADWTAFPIPGEADDMTALFASDSAPTGWMGADLAGVKSGDIVAVWGCGAVGQLAARAAMLLGADRVIAIDRYEYRLRMMREAIGAETINYETTDVQGELRERSGGRGPDVCIEAVGLEAHATGPQHRLEQAKQQTRILQTDRGHALRQAILACRKGGTVFCLGMFIGSLDRFPMGAIINKGITLRGAQQHGERYIPMLLGRMAKGELPTSHLATHVMSLDEGVRGYDLFKNRKDNCVRVVFQPAG